MITATELAQRLWEAMKDQPEAIKQGVLLGGVHSMLQSAQMFDTAPLPTPKMISQYRQAFTQWKAVARNLSNSEYWKRNRAFSQEQESEFIVAAFPAYFLKKAPLTLLFMVDNNMLLGWKPDVQMQGHIQQLRWQHPEHRTTLVDKGLAHRRAHRGVAR
jgi:hypothetical protein